MTISSKHYAELSELAYHPPAPDAQGDRAAHIDGVEYTVLKAVDKSSGYQGVIFQREDTGEIVVAHRGTEFTRQPLQDVIAADGGMVARRANQQADDAIELTRDAIRIAQADGAAQRTQTPVTVTGHSLGGCLAQVAAAKLNLHGETFNPYGAAGLGLRIPEGGRQVVNHVMAADMVSAASGHFGEVRVYASKRDVATLSATGYENNTHKVFDQRAPLLAAAAGLSSHSLHHFRDVDGKGRADVSVLDDPQSRQRADRYEAMIDKYRCDVWNMREGLSVGASIMQGATGIASEIGRHIPESAESPFKDAHGALPNSDRAPIDARDRDHPDHSMHQAIKHGVEGLFAQQGRSFDESAERTVSSLLSKAKIDGLERVDHVVAGGKSGTEVFAVQGDLRDPTHRRTHVNIETAGQVSFASSHSPFDTASQRLAQASQHEPHQEPTRSVAARSV